MKRLIIIFMCVFLCLGLTACAGSTNAGTETADQKAEAVNPDNNGSETVTAGQENTEGGTSDSQKEDTAHQDNADEQESGSDVLVAYFSATGTTKGVAERIASVTNADIYEITAAEPYTADDLNYNDSNSRSTKEQNDKSIRPEIGSEDISLAGYTTVYLGFPIWWGEEPRILDTFVEKYDFDGITVIPFCTSGGSKTGRIPSDNGFCGKF